MTPRRGNARAARTVLEQKIWERNETLAEFVDYAHRFARKIGETGTLSERNLKRLMAGHKPGGTPVSRPRPATTRLLERLLGLGIAELLAPPEHMAVDHHAESEHELRRMLTVSRRIDAPILALLQSQLDVTRRLDRELGAIIAHEEVITKIRQVTRLRSHSLTPQYRQRLAAISAELRTLAGWQALDLGNMTEAWEHYEQAKTAAKESGLPESVAHTEAEQAFVLLDLGETATAVESLDATRRSASKASPLLRSWLAAAHGEALAKDGRFSASLRSFDQAAKLLPADSYPNDGPYLALDAVHLARWRGHALARIGAAEAVDVLSSALAGLNRTFTRAETSLRVDLVAAFAAQGDRDEAQVQAERAHLLAFSIGSARQQRRLRQLIQTQNP